MQQAPEDRLRIDDLYPEAGKVLLTGTGKQFIERLGVEAARKIILKVMSGENIRTQTEPLTRQRLAQVSGAMLALLTRGFIEVPGFSEKMSQLALKQLASARRNDTAKVWPAQWLIGLNREVGTERTS
jgi:hypothetical protein